MENHEDVNLNELTPYQLKFMDVYMKYGNKRQAMENAVCNDGRERDMFQFYGANRSGR